jgi:hypothetical protein
MIMMRANLLVHYSGHWKEWALIMDIACIKIITSRAIETSGTLIFILSLRGALHHEFWGFSGHLTTLMTLSVAKTNMTLFSLLISVSGGYF